MPSSSARRRNAPNLISPLHRAQGLGVRPEVCSATKSSITAVSKASVRSQISNGNPAIAATAAASARAAGPQHPCSTPSRCTRDMCEPTTSYPCSCRRHAATDESTPPDIATSTDDMASRLPCRPRATRTYREPVIEARFDDLTGAEPSFRLVGPAGVLEARRPDEVPGVLAAAEQAAARSLWVAGFVTYEAAPGLDPALHVHALPHEGPFADLPLAWFAMFEGREETNLPEPPDAAAEPVTDRAAAWRPAMTRRDYDAAVDEIHRGIAAGDTYQVNLTMPL